MASYETVFFSTLETISTIMKLLLRFLALFLCAEKQKIYSEVVLDYSKCQKFFYKSAPPKIGFLNEPELDLAGICQKLGNVYHFGTLYSKYWRIPIYSAYELLDPQNWRLGPGGEIVVTKECASVQKSRGTWFIEPQVHLSKIHVPVNHSYIHIGNIQSRICSMGWCVCGGGGGGGVASHEEDHRGETSPSEFGGCLPELPSENR